jgi:GAF domain-containing protein/CheY-like chemotaxis protein
VGHGHDQLAQAPPDRRAPLRGPATTRLSRALAWLTGRRFGEARARQAQLAALLDITKRINAAESTEALLRAIAEEAARLLAVDNAGFRLVEGDELVLAGLAGTAAQTMVRPRIKLGESLSGRVVREGRTIVADVAAASELIPEHRAADERLGYTTFLGVPLRTGDRIIGAFAFRARRPFTPRDRELAEAFAEHAAVALEHARLFALEHARRAQIEILAEIERELAAELDLDRLLHLVVDRASRLFGADGVIYMVEGERTLVPCVWSERALFDRRVPFGHGVIGSCAAERRGFLVNDYPASPHAVETYVGRGLRRMLAHPLVLRDRLLGVISLSRIGDEALPFTPDHLAVLESFATQAAIAIENARLHEETERRRRAAESLARLARTLTESLEVSAVGERIVDSVLSLLRASSAGLRLLQPDGSLAAVAWGGLPDARFARGHVMPPGTGLAGAAIAERRAVWSADLLQDERVLLDADMRASLVARGYRAELAVPLQAKGRIIGVLSVADESVREFSPEEVALAQAFADQAALALENARLHEETERRLRETETVLAVSRTLSSTLDFDRLSRQLMREIARAIGADSVGVWMADETGQWLSPTIGYHVPPQWLPGIRGLRVSLAEHEFYAEAVRTRRAVFARDVGVDPRLPAVVRAAAPHRSQLFVPIVAKERVIGGFIAVWWEQERALAAGDLTLMEAIANQAGVALENLRLFEENRRQVKELSVLHGLSRVLTGQLDRQALLDALRQQLPRVLSVDEFAVLLKDDKAGGVEEALRLGLAGVVLGTGRPLRTADYQAECARRGVALAPGGGLSHWLGVPLVASNVALGVLTLSRRQSPFTDADERMAASIADLAALALRSAQLYEERARAYGELAAAQDHLVRTEKLRALGEMASGVAHDFNNLLAAILGRAQLLLRRVDDPRLRTWLGVIERSAMDGAQTVRRLQEFARVRRDEPLVPVDINEVVRDALEITQSRWRDDSLRRGVTIDVQTRLTPVPLIAGDPAELREAMTNLILNAIDAMPSGGHLTVASAVVNGQVEVTVSDTGLGIPSDIQDKIFDPFFTTKGPQGTGLGLSMTYGIVSRHGARIAVSSEEGRGSTFRMTFPPVPALAAPVEATATPAIRPGPLRCLVIDDEEAVGSVIGDVLESLGHRAVVLTDGAEAMDRFRAESFDAVFTDLAMPGMSGWQVAQAVKDTAREVPVFIVTGFGVTLSADERRAHGVEAVFSKPLKIDDVMDAMAHVAHRRDRADGREVS